MPVIPAFRILRQEGHSSRLAHTKVMETLSQNKPDVVSTQAAGEVRGLQCQTCLGKKTEKKNLM